MKLFVSKENKNNDFIQRMHVAFWRRSYMGNEGRTGLERHEGE